MISVGCMASPSHTHFFDKLHDLIVLMNKPNMESIIRSTLKYGIDVAGLLCIKGSRTLKILSIYHYLSAEIFIILPSITL